MKRLSTLIAERAMIAVGDTGQRHAQKYLSNPDTATYTAASNIEHIKAGERINIHGVRHDPETNRTYATVSRHGDQNNRVETPINKINKPEERRSGHGRREAEDTAISDLHNQIKNSKEPVMMKDRFGKTHRIVGAVQIEGNPKADLALVNDKGEHVIHISHKKSETSHQGYGAFNKAAHAAISTVKEFGRRLKNAVGENGNLERKSRTMDLEHSNSEHKNLIRTALFGQNHDSNKSGIENVDEIHHGKMNLVKNKDGTHSISSSEKIDRNNYDEHKYEFVAKFARDRKVPGTNIGGILGIWRRGTRGGRDVQRMGE